MRVRQGGTLAVVAVAGIHDDVEPVAPHDPALHDDGKSRAVGVDEWRLQPAAVMTDPVRGDAQRGQRQVEPQILDVADLDLLQHSCPYSFPSAVPLSSRVRGPNRQHRFAEFCNMDMRKLNYVVVLAETLSFTKAAEKLNLT